MRQSNKIIKQCIKWLRENPGPVITQDHKVGVPHRENEMGHGGSYTSLKLYTEGYCVPEVEVYFPVEFQG